MSLKITQYFVFIEKKGGGAKRKQDNKKARGERGQKSNVKGRKKGGKISKLNPKGKRTQNEEFTAYS